LRTLWSGSVMRQTRRARAADMAARDGRSTSADGGADAPVRESRWPPDVAVLVFIVVNVSVRLWLPTESTVGVPWLLPVVELVLLGVLLASNPLGVDRRATWLRRVSIALVCLLVVAAL